MLEMEQLRKLMFAVAKASADPTKSYSFEGQSLTYSAMEQTLREQIREFIPDYYAYEKNKYDLFALLSETMTEIMPKRIMDRYGSFAETKVYGQGDKPVFSRRMGRLRAKQFVTRVGLAGVYEVFKLGEQKLEVQTSAIGGAAQVSFEEFLDGRVDFNEVIQIVMEGMDELIYSEIAKALNAAANQLPAANKVVFNGFSEAAMDRLIMVTSAYGEGRPTIYCTYEFAVKMVPEEGWISDNIRDARWNNGYIANYKGCPVVVLPQTFTDETNSTKVIDPGYVWVIPNGENSQPVKVAFEGAAHMRERGGTTQGAADWSMTFETYQKVGVGVMMTNNIGSYVDTSLQGKLATIA